MERKSNIFTWKSLTKVILKKKRRNSILNIGLSFQPTYNRNSSIKRDKKKKKKKKISSLWGERQHSVS